MNKNLTSPKKRRREIEQWILMYHMYDYRLRTAYYLYMVVRAILELTVQDIKVFFSRCSANHATPVASCDVKNGIAR